MTITGRVTLESVAAHARVSRQTVSNAINSPDIVRPATLARVRASIAELGYRPSTAARQLRTRRSKVLGFALPPLREGDRGGVGDRFMHSLTEAAQVHGYRIMLFTAANDAEEIAQYEDLLHGADIDGFVLTNTHHFDPRTQWLLERNVPFVTFGRPWDNGQGGTAHPWVDVDGASGTAAATAHLLAQGHTRIAFVGWPEGSGVGDDRRSGWERTMREAGASATDLIAWQDTTLDDLAAATAATERLLDRAPEVAPTAFVCVSDAVALGVLNATRTRNRTSAVVGFDDSPVAPVIDLSSLAQPIADAARTALNILLARIGEPHEAVDSEQVLLPPDLMPRASSAAELHPH